MNPVSSGSLPATADASGVALASIGPVPLGQVWVIQRTSVQSSSVLASTAGIYLNSVYEPYRVDRANGTGNGATSGIGYRLRAGESVLVQWTGCTPGAVCTFSVDGAVEE